MKIRNVSAKLISVAGIVLLPDDERDFPVQAATAPVRALEKAGLLSIIDETPIVKSAAKKAPKAKEAPVEDPVESVPEEAAPVEEAPVEEKTKAKRTYKKKSEVAESEE